MSPKLNPQPVPASGGGLPATNATFTPGATGPFASPTAPNQINLQPGLLTGEAEIAKVQK